MTQTGMPYQQDVDAVAKADFIKKTYMHVALAVLAFVGIEALFLNTPFIRDLALSLTGGWTWLIMLGGFMFVTTMAEKWAMTSTNRTAQYAALALFVAAEAFIFLPMMFVVANMVNASALFSQAAILTLGLFTGLTGTAILSGKDFSFLRSALTIGGFVAIGLIVASILFGFNLGLWFSVAMVLLAAGSILYQTSNLLLHYNTDQYVAASLGLFASLMLMFWYILRILMSMSSD